jgi:hypothetical protein
MPANTPRGLPYPLPTEPVAEGALAIRNLAEAIKGWQCIGEKDPSPSIDVFTAIPQAFDHLRLVVLARSVTAAKFDELCLRLNGSVAAQYYRSNIVVNAGAVTGQQFLGETFGRIGWLPAATATAGFWSVTDLLIPFYSGTNYKTWTGTNYAHTPAASNNTDLFTATIGGGLVVGTAVTAIQLFGGPTGSLLASGSRAWLYGLSGV